MSAMEIRCPRCGSTWRVGDEKAGKKGRCPQCWGIIKVPDKKAEPAPNARRYVAPPASRSRKMFLIGAGIILVAGVVLSIVLRRGAQMESNGPDQELTPEILTRLKILNGELNQLARLEDRCNLLDDLAREERCLRAREVLRKDKAYEPVSPAEYALRAAVKEEEAAYRVEFEKKGEARAQDWRLDVPLREEERTLLTEKSAGLLNDSKEIAETLSQMGIRASERPDPLGRALLNTAGARKLLSARIEKLQTTISEVRNGAAAHNGAR